MSKLDEAIQSALSGSKPARGGIYDFANSSSAIEKAKNVLAIIAKKKTDFSKTVIISLGGADGTEIEHILCNSDISKGIMIEFDDDLAGIALKKSEELKERGKELRVFIGDVSQKIEPALGLIDEWRLEGKINNIIVTIHALLHELPARGGKTYDIAGLLCQFLHHDMPVQFIVREPYFPQDLPPIVELSANCQPTVLAALSEKIKNTHPEVFGEQKIDCFAENVSMSSRLAMETIIKIFYLDSFSYELQEVNMAFTCKEILTAFQKVFGTNNVNHTNLQSDSFNKFWKVYGFKLMKDMTELPKPQLHIYIEAKWAPSLPIEEEGTLEHGSRENGKTNKEDQEKNETYAVNISPHIGEISHEDREHLETKLKILMDRWRILDKKRVGFGTLNFPSPMQMELNEVEAEIREISSKLGISSPLERLKPKVQPKVQPEVQGEKHIPGWRGLGGGNERLKPKVQPEIQEQKSGMQQNTNVIGSSNVKIIRADGNVHYHEAERPKDEEMRNKIDTGKKDDLKTHKNPFIKGPMITNPKDFFGRKSEIKTIFTLFQSMSSCSVVGKRRIGKSSLLYYLTLMCQKKLGEDYKIAYVDLQSAECHTLIGLITTVGEKLFTPSILRQINSSSNISVGFERNIKELRKAGVRPVICLDKFEGLIERRGEFTNDFFESWRSLGKEGLAFITASQSKLRKLCDEGRLTSPFYNIFSPLELGVFTTNEEAWEFVNQDRPNIEFTQEEKEAIIQIAKGHPLKLQIAAWHITQAKIEGRFNLQTALEKAKAEMDDMIRD